MAFRTRTRYSLGAKILGIISAGAGVTILIRTLPHWFWFLVLGVVFLLLGWFLYFRR